MREHGVLNRILLIYDECAERLEGNKDFPMLALSRSATLIHDFVEQYHEKMEEEFVFPRFEKAGKLVELVAVLRHQHATGRTITDSVRRLCTGPTLTSDPARHSLALGLRTFVRMYRPHEAREDTVLFPAFRSVVPTREFHELGEQFEDREHSLFGKNGFEVIVQQVETSERELGIYDLARFTPE